MKKENLPLEMQYQIEFAAIKAYEEEKARLKAKQEHDYKNRPLDINAWRRNYLRSRCGY
jgi:hypothetical protein